MEAVVKRKATPRKKKSEVLVNKAVADSVEEVALRIEAQQAEPQQRALVPYTPRPIWAKELHSVMDNYRFVVLIAHRRFGKTVGLINQLIKMAWNDNKISPRFAYIAPWKSQAKAIAWDYIKRYVAAIPGIKINNTELTVEFPSKHKGCAGAKIVILGADNPDIIRGTYMDAVILDEYAQMPESFFGTIIRPLLSDRKGKCFFIGTPKGQNQLYTRYKKAREHMLNAEELMAKGEDPGVSGKWYAAKYTVYETGVLDEEEISDMKEDMTEIEFRQEMLCDFDVSVYNAVIPLELIEKSCSKKLTERDIVKGTPVVLGVDVARYGDDRTTIWMRKGPLVERPRVFKGLDTMAVVDQIIDAMRYWNPKAVFVDGGNMGAGVIDRLHQLGYTNVIEVPFGSSAVDRTRYENIRAEMYFKAKEWMEAGGALPDDTALRQELSSVEYKINKRSRIQLQAKDEIKKVTGCSPDLADGFVLTFAKPVAPDLFEDELFGVQKFMCKTEYNVLGG